MKKEPYITKRGDSFLVRVRTETNDVTKSFRVSKYPSEKIALDTARKFRDKTLYEMRMGLLVKRDNTTVKEIFHKYLDSSTLSANTKRKHQMQFNKFILHKDTKLQELTKADIQEDMNKMVEIASNDTISKVMSIWRTDIIQTAIMEDIIVKDLTLGVRKPESRMIHKKKSQYTDRATVNKVEDLLKRGMKNNYNARIACFLIEVLYYTGMRPAEAEVLTKDDIKGGYIYINKELGSSKDDINVVTKCKTEDSVRRVPIHPSLKPILEELIDYAEDDRLFLKWDGTYMDSTWLGNIITRICKKKGIEFNLYRLRHNVATSLVTNKVDQKTTIELLGHANYDMSLYYAASNDDLKENAINLVS